MAELSTQIPNAALPSPAVNDARQGTASTSEPEGKEEWVPPVLEHLGAWRAVTLQQSIPIGPG